MPFCTSNPVISGASAAGSSAPFRTSDCRTGAGPGARVATWITPRIAHYAEGTDVPLAEILPGLRKGADEYPALLDLIAKRADFLALVPERLDPEVREALNQATRHLPHQDVGAGKWRVRIVRLR